MTAPVDLASRTQAIEDVERSIALAAGAGSGKTSVLTSRLLTLLRRGVRPDRIAAITFTEKAAGEIRARVRERLEHELATRPEPALRDALDRFADLQLTTIHGFCRTLLLAESLAAGWAPDTDIFDGTALAPLLRDAVRAWRPGFERRHPDAALLVRVALTDDQAAVAARAMLTFQDLALVRGTPFDAAERHAALVDARDALERVAATCSNPKSDKLLANNAPLREALTHWVSLGAVAGVAEALLSDQKGDLRGGRKADWPDGPEALKAAVQAVRDWRLHTWARLHALLIDDLHGQLVPAVRAAKARAGVAQYDDLLFRARDVLLADPDVRARLASRFDALLIDEVQDTDPLQAEIALLLARAPEHGGPWDTHAPRPGAVFAVGDPKQSIYRFRRADVETWIELVNVVRQGGAGLRLQQNFRSVPGLVAWVNHVFRDMRAFDAQVAHRPAGALPPVVALHMTTPDEEPRAIASHLWSLRQQGLEAWSDVMILLPAWTRGDDLLLALARYGIPATIEGGRGFFSREEVRDALAALRCLSEPADTDALVHTLRAWFALTLDALAAYAHGGGALRLDAGDPPDSPVGRAIRALSRLRRARMRSSWVQLLDQLLAVSHAREAMALLPDARARFANLDKLASLIRELEAAGTPPSRVVAELHEQSWNNEDSVQSRDEPLHDAVRITSIFKAKGLEAPVVVLAHNQRKPETPTVAIDRAGRAYRLSLSGDLKPDGWEDAYKAECERYQEERHRWMYVAATRARDQLVVPLAERSGVCLSTAYLAERGLPFGEHDAIVEVADGAPVLVRHAEQMPDPPQIDGPYGPLGAALAEALDADGAVVDDEGQRWADARRQAIRAALRASPRVRTATEAARRERAPRDPDGGSGGLGRLGGTVLHEVLDHLDLQAPLEVRLADARALVERFAGERGLDPSLVAPCQAAVERVLHHDVFARLARAPEVWKEVPFAFEERGQHVHGVIDCCFPTDASRARWVVVDWKSDLPPAGSPARARYERQVQTYARALLATVTPCEHVEALLVGPHAELGAPSAQELALDRVEPALRPALDALLTAGAPVPDVAEEWDGGIVELRWAVPALAVLLDPDPEHAAALTAAGVEVLGFETDDVDWPERVEDALRARLLPAAPDAG